MFIPVFIKKEDEEILNKAMWDTITSTPMWVFKLILAIEIVGGGYVFWYMYDHITNKGVN